MLIKLDVSEMKRALTHSVNPTASDVSVSPAYEFLHLKAENGRFFVSSTNGYLWSRVELLPSTIDGDGEIMIRAASLAQAFDGADTGEAEILLVPGESFANIRHGSYHVKLAIDTTFRFYEMDAEPSGVQSTIDGQKLAGLLGAVRGCVSKEEHQRMLHGVCLEQDHNGYVAMAADGRRIGIARARIPGVREPARVTMLADLAAQAIKMAPLGEIEMTLGKVRATFSADGVSIQGLLNGSDFPDISESAMVPAKGDPKEAMKNDGIWAAVGASRLAKAVKRVGAVVPAKAKIHPAVDLIISRNRLELMSRKNGQVAEDEIAITAYGTTKRIIRVDPAILLSCVSACGTDDVVLMMTANRPLGVIAVSDKKSKVDEVVFWIAPRE
jgi:DNA polymerase III sliding clamp (beta) subunit (PCNA family)